MNEYNKHYININADGCIIAGFSDAFRQLEDGDICINDQGGYQFRLFPGGEENPQLMSIDGQYLYRYVNGMVFEKTQDELLPPIKLIRQSKTVEMNRACKNTIYTGIDVETSKGLKHFNLTEHDQANLTAIRGEITAAKARQESKIDLTQGAWYKADGEGEHHQWWGVDDMMLVINSAFAFISEQLTYCDNLKTYIRTLTDRDEVQAVYYGMEV